MDTIIFVTYTISVIALALSLYAVFEVREIRKEQRNRIIQRRLESIKTTKPKAKGLWD